MPEEFNESQSLPDSVSSITQASENMLPNSWAVNDEKTGQNSDVYHNYLDNPSTASLVLSLDADGKIMQLSDESGAGARIADPMNPNVDVDLYHKNSFSFSQKGNNERDYITIKEEDAGKDKKSFRLEFGEDCKQSVTHHDKNGKPVLDIGYDKQGNFHAFIDKSFEHDLSFKDKNGAEYKYNKERSCFESRGAGGEVTIPVRPFEERQQGQEAHQSGHSTDSLLDSLPSVGAGGDAAAKGDDKEESKGFSSALISSKSAFGLSAAALIVGFIFPPAGIALGVVALGVSAGAIYKHNQGSIDSGAKSFADGVKDGASKVADKVMGRGKEYETLGADEHQQVDHMDEESRQANTERARNPEAAVLYDTDGKHNIGDAPTRSAEHFRQGVVASDDHELQPTVSRGGDSFGESFSPSMPMQASRDDFSVGLSASRARAGADTLKRSMSVSDMGKHDASARPDLTVSRANPPIKPASHQTGQTR